MHRISNLMLHHPCCYSMFWQGLILVHSLLATQGNLHLFFLGKCSIIINSWKGFIYHTDTLQDCEKLICKINNAVEADTTNEVRTILFKRGIKAELLPLTSDALKWHIIWAHYQSMVWLKALESHPDIFYNTKWLTRRW